MAFIDDQLYQDLISGVAGGMTTKEMIDLLTVEGKIDGQMIYQRLYRLEKNGIVKHAAKGIYVLTEKGESQYGKNGSGAVQKPQPDPTPAPAAAHAYSDGLPEIDHRKVQIPEMMKSRSAVTLYVERSPTELENVLRLELMIGGITLPLPVTSDLRVCIGEDIPRWSATQETYNGVTGFRVTYRNGDQYDYSHNPKVPLTVDAK